MTLQDLQKRYNAAVEARDEALAALDAAPDTLTADEVDALSGAMDSAQGEVERAKELMEKRERLERARSESPAVTIEVKDSAPEARSTAPAGARVVSEPATYRPDTQASFFRDIVFSGRGDSDAAERLQRHKAETEKRDVSTSDPGAAGFIPPVYLADKWAELPRPKRPFVDLLPKFPIPPAGMTLTVPKVQSGVTIASQATENTAISETDIDSQTVTTPVRTIGGLNDISVQALERSYPGMDMIIFDDLNRAYEVQTDSQALHGAGTSGTHTGIFTLAGTNAVSYTDASPTAAELLPKVYDAIQRIESNRYSTADAIIMHPRRAAWLASNLSTSFPLFQQGGLYQASGTQDMGMVEMFAGLRVIRDPNIATNLGVGTNEDAIAVVSLADLFWAEGDRRIESFRDVGSANLTVRLRLYAFSAFVANRQPTAISAITGTGLVAPTF